MPSTTDIEQSQRLVELGLPRETADMGWYHTLDPYMADTHMYLHTQCSDTCLPAWSFKALWEVMPGVIYGPKPKDHPTELIHTKECICYFDNTGLQHGPSFSTKDGDITAAYNMVCWLLENGYIGERKKNMLETLRNFLNTATKDELDKIFNEVSERCNTEKTSNQAE